MKIGLFRHNSPSNDQINSDGSPQALRGFMGEFVDRAARSNNDVRFALTAL
jgi:hypothetical protein